MWKLEKAKFIAIKYMDGQVQVSLLILLSIIIHLEMHLLTFLSQENEQNSRAMPCFILA